MNILITNDGATLDIMPLNTADTSSSVVSDATSSEAEQPGGMDQMLTTFLLFGVMILAMYFIILRPQKKKEKQQKVMRSALAVGDTVVTIGGITGIVVGVREDSVVIETGSDRDKIRVKKWAIQEITELNAAAQTVDSEEK